MARTCHCTDGCNAAKAASRGASHSEATEPLAEIASIGRAPLARSRTASQAVASCAKVASTVASSDAPSGSPLCAYGLRRCSRVSADACRVSPQTADLVAHSATSDMQRQCRTRE